MQLVFRDVLFIWNRLAVLAKAFEVAADRIASHFAGFAERASKTNKPGQDGAGRVR